MKKQITITISALWILFILFSSCASLPKEMLPKEDEYVKIDPLEVRPAIEPLLIRADIQRQQECTTNGSQTTCTSVPYHFMGVYLGNGIFLDYHRNLSLDIGLLLGLDKINDYTIKETRKILFKEKEFSTVRKGKEIRVRSPGLFKEREVVMNLTNNGILLKDGGRIVVDQNGARPVDVPEKSFLGISFSGFRHSIDRVSPDAVEMGKTES